MVVVIGSDLCVLSIYFDISMMVVGPRPLSNLIMDLVICLPSTKRVFLMFGFRSFLALAEVLKVSDGSKGFGYETDGATCVGHL